MWGHPSEERLLDVALGAGDAAARAHAQACARCGERVDAARGGLSLAREADVLPEPAPVYWEAFRRRVDQRIVAAPASRGGSGWLPAFAGAGALLALAVLLAPGLRAPRAGTEARTLPAWSALPPAAEDEGLVLIEQLGPTEDLILSESPRVGIASAVLELTETEQQQLKTLLRGGDKS